MEVVKIAERIVRLRDLIDRKQQTIVDTQSDVYAQVIDLTELEKELKQLEAFAGCIVLPEPAVEN